MNTDFIATTASKNISQEKHHSINLKESKNLQKVYFLQSEIQKYAKLLEQETENQENEKVKLI